VFIPVLNTDAAFFIKKLTPAKIKNSVKNSQKIVNHRYLMAVATSELRSSVTTGASIPTDINDLGQAGAEIQILATHFDIMPITVDLRSIFNYCQGDEIVAGRFRA
jgi:hypothetical protein